MRKNSFVAIDHIKALNEHKQDTIQHGNLPLSDRDFKNLFKSCNIPSNSLFFLEFRNFGLLTKIGKNMYTWSNELPIHHKSLQIIYERYQQRANTYVHTYLTKKKEAKILKDKEIEDAIYLLKSNGFEVFAPSSKFYVKL